MYKRQQYNSVKGIILVQSGVETKNLDKARDEILAQLEEMKKGNITDDELDAAKLSIVNGLRTLSDSLGGLESWYLSQTFSPELQRPEEAAEEISAVTREAVISAANKLTLDTVYRLTGSEGKSE